MTGLPVWILVAKITVTVLTVPVVDVEDLAEGLVEGLGVGLGVGPGVGPVADPVVDPVVGLGPWMSLGTAWLYGRCKSPQSTYESRTFR